MPIPNAPILLVNDPIDRPLAAGVPDPGVPDLGADRPLAGVPDPGVPDRPLAAGVPDSAANLRPFPGVFPNDDILLL